MSDESTSLEPGGETCRRDIYPLFIYFKPNFALVLSSAPRLLLLWCSLNQRLTLRDTDGVGRVCPTYKAGFCFSELDLPHVGLCLCVLIIFLEMTARPSWGQSVAILVFWPSNILTADANKSHRYRLIASLILFHHVVPAEQQDGSR